MTANFYCQFPDHQGSRLIDHPGDRWIKKVTYRRLDQGQRLYERAVMDICRKCIELDVPKQENGQVALI